MELANYLASRELDPRLKTFESIYRKYSVHREFQHRKRLLYHTGCVNALQFSGDGSLMASGGDDLGVLLWKVESLGESWSPVKAFKGHLSNIFSIQFDSCQQNIYSAGNDGFLIKYDIEHTTISHDMMLAHEDACLKLSISPINDNLILSAGQDWCVKLWDMRTKKLQGNMDEFGKRQNYVQFNPMFPHLFVTCDDRGGIYLHDIRSSFQRSPSQSKHLIKYTTRLCKGKLVSRPIDVTSAVWSPCGLYLGASLQRYHPIIYSNNEPDPLCELQMETYSSLATVKSGTFCETFGELSFFSGSDDGQVYGWKMPPKDVMTHYQKHTMEVPSENQIMFQNLDHNVIPMTIPRANYTLTGCKSVVNTVIAHPTFPYIAAAGVEKYITIFAPHEIPNETDSSNSPGTREDPATLEFFSKLIDNERESIEERLWRPAIVFESEESESNDSDEVLPS